MELFVAGVALVLSIGDFLGHDRALRLERRLVDMTSQQLRGLRAALITGWRAAPHLMLSAISCLLVAVLLIHIIAPQRFDNTAQRYLGRAAGLVPLFTFLLLPLVSFLLMVTLPHAMRSLASEPEAPVYRWVSRTSAMLFDEQERRVRTAQAAGNRDLGEVGNDPPVLGPAILSAGAFPALLCLSVWRACGMLVSGGLWMVLGLPTIALNRLAQQLGNPSYFDVGKYLLLVAAFVALLVGR